MFYMPVIYTSPAEYQVVDDLQLTPAALRKIRAIVKVYTRVSTGLRALGGLPPYSHKWGTMRTRIVLILVLYILTGLLVSSA